MRTVLRRAASDRWNPEAVKGIKATPRNPNPEDQKQRRAQPERDARTKKIELEEDGVDTSMDYVWER